MSEETPAVPEKKVRTPKREPAAKPAATVDADVVKQLMDMVGKLQNELDVVKAQKSGSAIVTGQEEHNNSGGIPRAPVTRELEDGTIRVDY